MPAISSTARASAVAAWITRIAAVATMKARPPRVQPAAAFTSVREFTKLSGMFATRLRWLGSRFAERVLIRYCASCSRKGSVNDPSGSTAPGGSGAVSMADAPCGAAGPWFGCGVPSVGNPGMAGMGMPKGPVCVVGAGAGAEGAGAGVSVGTAGAAAEEAVSSRLRQDASRSANSRAERVSWVMRSFGGRR